MPNTFASSVEISLLDARHPDAIKNQSLYTDLEILYKGGKLLKEHATRFLQRHSKEIGQVFAQKADKINYDNVLATIVSYYTSELFKTDLDIDFKLDGVATVNPFYSDFLLNCDRAGTSLERFYEKVAIDCLVFGQSTYLIDLPKLTEQPTTQKQQDDMGALNAYLCPVSIQALHNYQFDEFGNYEFVVIYGKQLIQEFLGKPSTVETWTYYDRQQFAKYQITYTDKRPTHATLVDSGKHALSALNQVPLRKVSADDKLFLGQRIYLGLIEYFNAINSLGWSLFLALNPLPVIIDPPNGEADATQTVSEYAFLKLPYGSSFSWVEPEGRSWLASHQYIESLREALYRSCHLIVLGRSSKSAPSAISGASKEIDMSPSASVLNTVGSLIRNEIQNTLTTVSKLRDDKVNIDCRGMNFSTQGAAAEVELWTLVDVLQIQSETLKKEGFKKIARACLLDANSDLLQQICSEIETNTLVNIQVAPAVEQVSMNVTDRTSTN